MKEMITFPPQLSENARIAIISPAGFVKKEDLENTLNIIENQGFIPVLGKYVYGRNDFGYPYSGTEKERKKDLEWALNDEKIDAVWASRGGYGCMHLLSGLNISGFKKKPKWYIGYSDNTAIQSFLMRKGYASIHGQTIKTADVGIGKNVYSKIFDIFKNKFPSYTTEKSRYNRTGKVSGQIIGGNLSLIYALIGTPYSFDFSNTILFIEEIGERFYALDRMLMALELSGAFKKIKGLIVGGMTNMGNEKENNEYKKPFDNLAYEIIRHRIEKYDFPVAFRFPNGHIHDNFPLIIGAEISMEVSEKTKIVFQKLEKNF